MCKGQESPQNECDKHFNHLIHGRFLKTTLNWKCNEGYVLGCKLQNLHNSLWGEWNLQHPLNYNAVEQAPYHNKQRTTLSSILKDLFKTHCQIGGKKQKQKKKTLNSIWKRQCGVSIARQLIKCNQCGVLIITSREVKEQTSHGHLAKLKWQSPKIKAGVRLLVYTEYIMWNGQTTQVYNKYSGTFIK